MGYLKALWPSKNFVKASNVVGATMGELHPVGDAAIYEALVGLVNAPFCPWDGSGSWGIPALDESEAAPRYTECRLHPIGMEMFLDDYYLNVIDMVPTYDNARQEPVVLPARLPMLLLNGSEGIAVAATTRVPSFEVKGLLALLREVLARKDRTVTAADCSKHLRLYSQWGGVSLNSKASLKPLWETGICSLKWKCAYTYDEKSRTIRITGLPPGWSYTSRVASLANHDLVRQVRDGSYDDKICIDVILRPSATKNDSERITKDIINKLLHTSYTTRINVVDSKKIVTDEGFVDQDSTFKSISTVELLNAWIKWRIDLEKRAAIHWEADLQRKKRRETALLLATRNLDALVKIVRSKTVKDKLAAIAKLLNIELEEAKIVWDTPLGRFDNLSEAAQLDKIKSLDKQLKTANATIKAPAKYALADLETIDVAPVVKKMDKEPKAKRNKKA